MEELSLRVRRLLESNESVSISKRGLSGLTCNIRATDAAEGQRGWILLRMQSRKDAPVCPARCCSISSTSIIQNSYNPQLEGIFFYRVSADYFDLYSQRICETTRSKNRWHCRFHLIYICFARLLWWVQLNCLLAGTRWHPRDGEEPLLSSHPGRFCSDWFKTWREISFQRAGLTSVCLSGVSLKCAPYRPQKLTPPGDETAALGHQVYLSTFVLPLNRNLITQMQQKNGMRGQEVAGLKEGAGGIWTSCSRLMRWTLCSEVKPYSVLFFLN